MRADRLVAVLLILQRKEKVTALEIAAELEISERTARRDLEALAAAGIPVYPSQGRGGGWRLLGGAKTDLSGLTADETRALFLLAGPSSATPEVRSALRKLVRALPESFRDAAESAAASVIIDPTEWGGSARRFPLGEHHDAVQTAVVDGAQVRLAYIDREQRPSDRVVDPLGLAMKGTRWYLLANTPQGLRTFRVDRVVGVERTGALVQRPADFNLADTWRLIAEEVDLRRTPVIATVRLHLSMLGPLRSQFQNRLSIGGADGHPVAEIRGFCENSLAGELAGFAASITVEGPEGVRTRLAEIGRELASLYALADTSTRSSVNPCNTNVGANRGS
jgi:predicted DNA-binding transcriptional regulator YafY